MAQNSRGSLVTAKRRQQVANLYLQGWLQASIAEHLKVCQTTVSRDLKRIQADWRASAIRDFDMQCAIELQKLDRLERESWAAWERSQKPSQQARVRGSQSEQDAERTIKNQVGDPRFLEQVHKCIAARRELLGLDGTAKPGPSATEVLPPLTPEERRAHIMAIIREVQQRTITEQQTTEAQTIDANCDPVDD